MPYGFSYAETQLLERAEELEALAAWHDKIAAYCRRKVSGFLGADIPER